MEDIPRLYETEDIPAKKKDHTPKVGDSPHRLLLADRGAGSEGESGIRVRKPQRRRVRRVGIHQPGRAEGEQRHKMSQLEALLV
jgi:hypothetical protein